MTIAAARPASTVVLLRPSAHRFDVCLVRRHDEVAFMGGAHVFPGGRVDEADRSPAAENVCDGTDAAVRRMPALPRDEVIGRHVAAIRELFEEAGVLLARRDSQPIALDDPADAPRWSGYRSALAGRAVTMPALAERERLRLMLDGLVWFAHWLTPEIEIKRYDVTFFLAVLPPGQETVPDHAETTAALWLDPADAVGRCRAGEIALPPPTWTTLRTLERFASVDAVWRWAETRRVERVQPRFVDRPGASVLTLPGDESYPPLDGFDTPRETRFILTDGRWRAVE